MTAEILFASLHIATPELILAVGALALLMIGVFSGDKSTTTVTGLAVALLLVVGLWIIFAPHRAWPSAVSTSPMPSVTS